MPLPQDTASNAPSSPGRSLPRDRTALWVFCLVYAIGLGFAFSTEHVWDDFYVTFRTSKNLATGHGLVFTPGQRVQAFTSPVNVLLPAAFSYATGNESDLLVLWLFRVVSLGALAVAAVLLYRIAKAHAWGTPAVFVLVGLFATDAKIVDFSINGQETGFMMLFLAMMLHALLVPGRRSVLRLALAWSGLLWTRTDACVYIAFVCGAFLLFNAATAHGSGRLKLLKAFIRAGVIAAVLYAPWVIWAWWYYGSPVPHTIIAKGLDGASSALPLTLGYLIQRLAAGHTLYLVFGPPYPYAYAWDWPRVTAVFCTTMAWLASWYWLLPLGAPARAASLAFLACGWYLAVVNPAAGPENYPNVAIIGFYVIAQTVQQASTLLALLKDCVRDAAAFRPFRWLFHAAVAAMPLVGAVMLVFVTAEIQQFQVEDGQRCQVGLWLRDHARSPHDSVFLDQLGYVGYFSQLNMLDWPGVSSPQVVAARRDLPPVTSPHWAQLIEKLHPDWIVLRPTEVGVLTADDPSLLEDQYRLAKVWYYYKVYTANAAGNRAR